MNSIRDMVRRAAGIKVILAPTWELAEPLEADVTVEAEYGAHVKEGSKKTIAHHTGKYQGNVPASAQKPAPMGSGTILVSHLDHDTIVACMDLMGKGSLLSDELRELIAHVDIHGDHKIDELQGVTEQTKAQLHAWDAYGEHLHWSKSEVTDVTAEVDKAIEIMTKAAKNDPEQIAKGKEHWDSQEKLDKDTFKGMQGSVVMREGSQFINHLYRHVGDDGKALVAKGVISFRPDQGNSISISVSTPIPGKPMKELAQALWGSEAGGNPGIAGSPRGKAMTREQYIEAAKALDAVINGGEIPKPKTASEPLDWVGQSLFGSVPKKMLEQQPNKPCPECRDHGAIPPLVNYCRTCGRKLGEHGAR